MQHYTLGLTLLGSCEILSKFTSDGKVPSGTSDYFAFQTFERIWRTRIRDKSLCYHYWYSAGTVDHRWGLGLSVSGYFRARSPGDGLSGSRALRHYDKSDCALLAAL